MDADDQEKERRILRVLLGGLGIVLGTAFGLLILGGRDIARFDAEDLRREIPTLATEDNARTWFVKAAEIMVWPDEAPDLLQSHRQGEPGVENDVAELLELNRMAMEMIREGNQRERAVYTGGLSLLTEIPEGASWRWLSRMMEAEALLAHDRGDLDAAVDVIGRMFRFGGLLAADAECMIPFLIAAEPLHQAAGLGARLARDERAGSALLARLASLIPEGTILERGWGSAVKGEHEGFATTIRMMAADTQGNPPRILQNYLLHPERTIRMNAALFRGTLEVIHEPYPEGLDAWKSAWEDHARPEGWRGWVVPNHKGWLSLSLFGDGGTASVRRYHEVRCDLDSLRVVVALERFRRERGGYPDTLDRLVPEYLPDLPMDTYSRKNFRDDATSGAVLSAGPGGDGVVVPQASVRQGR